MNYRIVLKSILVGALLSSLFTAATFLYIKKLDNSAQVEHIVTNTLNTLVSMFARMDSYQSLNKFRDLHRYSDGSFFKLTHLAEAKGENAGERTIDVQYGEHSIVATVFGGSSDKYSILRVEFARDDLVPGAKANTELIKVALLVGLLAGIPAVVFNIMRLRFKSAGFDSALFRKLTQFKSIDDLDGITTDNPVNREFINIIRTEGARFNSSLQEKNAEIAKLSSELATSQSVQQNALEMVNRRNDSLKKLAHQIGTPIGNISKEISLVRENFVNSPEEKRIVSSLNSMQRSCSVAVEYIDNVLRIGSLDNKAIEPKIETIDLHELVSAIITDYEETETTIIAEFDNLPRIVRSDKNCITQVAASLFSNAIKYTDSGYVQISSETTYSIDIAHISFKITDTGTGIPHKYHNTIFDAYERGGKTESTDGLGLGLAIAKQMAEKLDGGEVELVRSEPGKGSQFTFSFNCQVEHLNMDQNPPAHSAIVISDDEVISSSISQTLKYASCDAGIGEDIEDYSLTDDIDIATLVYAPSIKKSLELIKSNCNKLAALHPNALVILALPLQAWYKYKNNCDLPNVRYIKQPFTTFNYVNAALAHITLRRKTDGTIKVLAVDDLQSNLNTLESMFSRMENVELTSCDSGYKAVSACHETQFDIILIDWHMPGQSGSMTTARIRETRLNANTPTILHTAQSQYSYSQYESEFDEILNKSATLDDIANAIEKHTKIPVIVKRGSESLEQKDTSDTNMLHARLSAAVYENSYSIAQVYCRQYRSAASPTLAPSQVELLDSLERALEDSDKEKAKRLLDELSSTKWSN